MVRYELVFASILGFFVATRVTVCGLQEMDNTRAIEMVFMWDHSAQVYKEGDLLSSEDTETELLLERQYLHHMV